MTSLPDRRRVRLRSWRRFSALCSVAAGGIAKGSELQATVDGGLQSRYQPKIANPLGCRELGTCDTPIGTVPGKILLPYGPLPLLIAWVILVGAGTRA